MKLFLYYLVLPYLKRSNLSYEGQARFWRAFYLWLIVENWGDVVLYTEPVVGAVTEAHRSSVD